MRNGNLVDTQTDDSIERILNLREQVAAQAALVSAMRRDFLPFFKPHAKQQLFFEAAGAYNRRAVFAGNRFGKSQMGAAEDCSWLRGERPWYPKDSPLRTLGIPQRPVKGLVITTDWDKVDEIWTNQSVENPGKLWKFLDRGMVQSMQRHSGSAALDTVVLNRGSILRFDTVKSFLSNPQGSESSDFDFIHVDEPCPEAMFKANARGLIDRNGAAWFTLTALSEPWIIDLFFGDCFGGTPKENTWSIVGSTYDNPYLSPAAIKQFEDTLTEDEKECRMQGIPLILSGLVYKEFRAEKHVLTSTPAGWSAPNDPPANYCIYVFIDPHPQTPTAVLFCAVSPEGYRFYYHEIFEKWTTEETATAIRKHLNGRRLVTARIDPLAYIPDPINRAVPAQEYIRAGVPVLEATKDLHNGIINAQQMLKKAPPSVFFLSHLRRTLWEFKHYVWKKDGSNKPVDKDDHMMENFYRCEMLRPRWYDTQAAFAPIQPYVVQPQKLILPINFSLTPQKLSIDNPRSPYGKRNPTLLRK